MLSLLLVLRQIILRFDFAREEFRHICYFVYFFFVFFVLFFFAVNYELLLNRYSEICQAFLSFLFLTDFIISLLICAAITLISPILSFKKPFYKRL